MAQDQDVNYKQATLESENNATLPRIQAALNCTPECSKFKVTSELHQLIQELWKDLELVND